ncbi:beta-xylosidase [Saccharopolyspora rosea]
MLAVLLAGCTDAVPERHASTVSPVTAPPVPVALTTTGFRQSSGVVVSGGPSAPYDYGPTVLAEGGRYRVWWCSQLPGAGPAGDDVLHAESDRPDGPFPDGVAVFSGRPGGFDGMHTCDPSVLRVGGRYYLYYTGAAGDHAHGNAIGVASSADGINWQRAGGGSAARGASREAGGPIVTASHEVERANDYGAGQPSALYLDGWFYLMFTDTTASGAGWNGAGQFVLRARDPEFTDDVQALTAEGFRPADRSRRSRSVVDAFSADWMWVPALDAFAIAHQTAEGTTITFWDRDFTRHPYRPVVVPGPWQEGPGLVRGPEGRAPVSTSDPCGTVPIDVLRATVLNPAPTGIRHFGIDVSGAAGCARADQALAVLDGFGVPSPTRTVDVVRGGVKVRVERRSVAERIVPVVLDRRVSAVDGVPVAGTIRAQAPALRAPNGDLGLLDDRGRLWMVGPAAVAANESPVTDVSQRDWDARAVAGDLRP